MRAEGSLDDDWDGIARILHELLLRAITRNTVSLMTEGSRGHGKPLRKDGESTELLVLTTLPGAMTTRKGRAARHGKRSNAIGMPNTMHRAPS